MYWRLLSALIILFWAVMTGLIIRDTYFPDHSRFAQVPPQYVFDLFLKLNQNQSASFNNTLQLFRHNAKIGHMQFTIRRETDAGEGSLYGVTANGSVDVPLGDAKPVSLSFGMKGGLMNADTWKSLEIALRAPNDQMSASLTWKDGDKMPSVEVKNEGQVVMNTPMIQGLMAVPGVAAGKVPWLGQVQAQARSELEKSAAAGKTDKGTPLRAREGVMDLAGKQRRCYIVSMDVMHGQEVRLYFTEVGELARIELPQGYRFVEPLMHGLEPGMNTMQ